MTRHEEAAALLLSARSGADRLSGLPEALRPRDEADAYAIQGVVSATLGPIGGWKVGVPNPQSMQFTCAPLPAAALFDSPARISGRDRVVEAEIAVRLGRDLPPREAPYAIGDIEAAITSAHPAIEVVETRFADVEAVGPLPALADSLSNHSLVVGPAIPDWASVDLAQETVRLRVDSRDIKTGTGNPGGEMLRMLVWLANVGTRWAGGLRAGQVVTTGSWTGKDTVPANAEVRAEFGHCGAVTLRFTQ